MKNNRQYVLVLILGFTLWSCSDSSEGPISGELPAVDLIDENYGSDPRQVMNVYLPADRSEQETPVLIYIHGGAWIDGDKSEFDAFRAIAEESFPDYAFVSIGYRLHDLFTGANSFPTQEQDVISAIEYIESQLPAWNVSDDLLLAGASAGGHLALLHAYKHQEIGNVSGVMALFPPTELSSLHSFNLVTGLGLNSIIGGSPTQFPLLYEESSPITYVTNSSVPTIFFHGTIDDVVPISQSDQLANALENQNVTYQYTIIEGQGHGFTAQTYIQVFQEAAAFMEGVFND